MELTEFINNLNETGKLEYNDYSQLHDLASDLKAENAELKARLERADMALEIACHNLRANYYMASTECIKGNVEREELNLQSYKNQLKNGNYIK